MSIRWRCDGTMVCGAKSQPRDCDSYIDDRLQYQLSQELGVIAPAEDEATTGLWHWTPPTTPAG